MNASNSNLGETKALLLAMVAEADDLRQAAGGCVTDAVAAWLAPQYLLAAREKLSAAGTPERFETLRMFVNDWAMLRRGDHAAARLQLDREQLEWERANGKSQKEQEFREWIKRPEIREEYFPEHTGGITPETLKKIQEALKLM